MAEGYRTWWCSRLVIGRVSRHTIIEHVLSRSTLIGLQVAIRGLANLVVQCTAFSPDHRPSVADILQVSLA